MKVMSYEVMLDVVSTQIVQITATTWPTPYSTYEAQVELQNRTLHKTIKGRGIDQCFVCNRQFCPEDSVYLAIVDYKYSVFICQRCGSMLLPEPPKEKEDVK